MQLSDFDYALPDAQVAQHPPARRRDARLLALDASAGKWRDLQVAALPSLLRPNDVVVVNDTRVIPARLFGRKPTGGAVEILIERMLSAERALAHLRASKPTRPGTRIELDGGGAVEVRGRDGALFLLQAADGEALPALLARSGHIPLPPYITRADEPLDAERYQTVYADQPGAVAAPTAGLHLDEAMLDEIRAQGATLARVTLHVGAGTFQPVRGEDIESHVMHAEVLGVSTETCAQIAAARAAGGRVVAIGTTVVRALESAAQGPAGLAPMHGDTRLFIRPGFEFRVVDALLTNFHLPRSTLLMLVSTFGGHARVMAAYSHAVTAGYRFFSYGDAMWLERAP
ncbi:MAG: tRNA preQ1(34) S-adenosylmethionine ribosyltransferase-isomerase QueA [Gammaproteobacteria bacterium]